MKTYLKHLVLATGTVISILLGTVSTQAALFPDNRWYVFGDTVTIGFPRITYSTIQRQITETEYNDQSCAAKYGTEGLYSTDDDHYYYFTYTLRDTITLVFSARPDNSGNYSAVLGYLANEHGQGTTLDDLWYVKDVTPTAEDGNNYWPRERVRMRVQHLQSGKWLSYVTNASGNTTLKLVDTEEQSSPFGYFMDEEDPNYQDYHSARTTSFMPVIISGASQYYLESVSASENSSISGDKTKGNYIKVTRSMTYAFHLTPLIDKMMICYQWSMEDIRSFNITPSPASPFFGYAKDNTEAAAQQVEQTYGITMTEAKQLYCVNERQTGSGNHTIPYGTTATVNNATDLYNNYGISANFYWAANGKGSYSNLSSSLKAEQIDNTKSNVAPYNAETARTMLTRSAATRNTQYTLTVTPVGSSPYNVINTSGQFQGNLCDYTDYLYCDIIDQTGNILATEGSLFTRNAYHIVEQIANIKVSSAPDMPIAEATEGTLTITYDPQIVSKQIRYNQQGIIDSIFSQTDTPIELSSDNLTLKLQTTENNDFTGDWVSISNIDYTNKQVTLSFQANAEVAIRGIYLVATVKNGDDSYTLRTYIRQKTSNSTGTTQFRHQTGGYDALMTSNALGIQYQQVHTYEKTVYYTSGQTIELMPNEPNMRGYWRWYDFDSDTDPRYYWNGTSYQDAGNNFWIKAPRDMNYTSFSAINGGEGGASRGYYATKDSHTFPEIKESPDDWENMMPQIKGWSDNSVHNIALDASAYANYTIEKSGSTITSITEPILSYRQIWHLRPASEIADSLDKCTSEDNPYETHKYIAPTSTNVYLATNFPHKNYIHHSSELCYWFYGKSNSQKTLKQVGTVSKRNNITASWKYRYSNDGGSTWTSWTNLSTTTYTNDYLTVSSTQERIYEYALYISSRNTYSGKDIYIARFRITYVSPTTYGPSSTALRTNDDIAENYNLLAEQDFDFGAAAGSLSSSSMQFYTKPLPAENSTFSFYYVTADNTHQYQRQTQGEATTFPFYGEYCLVNQLKKAGGTNWWIDIAQHGGATSGAGNPANGYMMYVDGKQQPGLVATVSTDAAICSGQQMYCSAWICNATSSSTNTLPVIRFNVQGRNSNDEDWIDVGAFFMGDLKYNSGWVQVNFPILSATDYKQTRVAIYNFANSNSGNDFLIDDICLYDTKLPLQAYQAFTTCKVKNMEMAVARIDYSNLVDNSSNQTLYYTFVNTKKDTMIHAIYHYPATWTEAKSDSYGIIYVPKKGYDPTKSNDPTYQSSDGFDGVDESQLVYTSASALLDSLENVYLNDTLPGKTVEDGYTLKGYVKTTDKDGERYIMYIAHLVSDWVMPSSASYQLNMAASEADLLSPECSMRADLPLSNKTDIAFNGSTDPTVGACANGLYPVVVKVNNSIEINGEPINLAGNAKADWLFGYEFDDVYIEEFHKTDEEKAAADTKFEQVYGYNRGKVLDALLELRRYPNTSNYTVSDPDEIITDTIDATSGKRNNILLDEHYNIIIDLCNRGLLSLYKDSDAFYMRSNDTIRFWVYPIAGTAVGYYEGTRHILDNCSNSTFLRGFTGDSEYEANLSPVQLVNMTDEQKHAVPRVRVAARNANKSFKIPISDISGNVAFGWDSCKVVSSTDPIVQALIDKNASLDEFSMRYTQDRIYEDLTDANQYYKSGDSIQFSPVDDAHVSAMQYRYNNDTPAGKWTVGHPGFQHSNTHKMRAGYEYMMKVTMLTAALNTEFGGCPIGNVYFTVVVVPDTVVWNPIASDYWGDDENWHAIIDGKIVEKGYVPLPETDVVIPTIDDVRKYPYLCDSMFYPMDAHYVPAKCHKIRFCGNTALLNQHKLQYDSAYADLTLKNGTWNLISSPLQDVYSGDFFVPHNGSYTSATNLENGDNFTISSFKGSRSADAGYASWGRYYNDSVATEHYYEPDGSFYESFNMFKQMDGMLFAASNTLDKELEPLHGMELGIWGPDNLTEDDITIRLPKPDTQYDKYYNGAVVGNVSVDRSNAYRLAFTPDNSGEMQVTLHNAVASPYFIFGNPTMAYIDAEAFYFENKDVLESYYWTLEGDEWLARTGAVVSYEDRFLKPFRSAMVYTKGGVALKELTLKLNVKNLAISNVEGSHTNYEKHSMSAAPKRNNSSNGHYLNKGIMHIDAFIRTEGSMQPMAKTNFNLVAMDFANDGYDVSEDVPYFSVNIKDDGTTMTGASEMNMYSVVDAKRIAIDIRKEIGVVPLGFVISNAMRSADNGKMRLYFTLTDWSDECYLIDTKTGTQTRIINGTELLLEIPNNHEMRYYIQGPKNASEDDKGATDTDCINSDSQKDGNSIAVYSIAEGYVNVVASSSIASVRLYDIVGRLVTEQVVNNQNTPILTLPAPEGVLMAEVRLTNGAVGVEKVLVK